MVFPDDLENGYFYILAETINEENTIILRNMSLQIDENTVVIADSFRRIMESIASR